MNTRLSGLLLVLGCAAAPTRSASAVELKGKVDAVTVYRGQALVSRLIELPDGAGLQEIVVVDLPEHVIPASIHAESADGVEVRSVRYRVRPVEQDVREEVRHLDAQIRELEQKLAANERFAQLAAEQKAYLGKLEQFIAPTAQVELTQGVLNAETLERLSSFLYEQRKDVTQAELTLGIEHRNLCEEIDLLKRQRHELAGASARTAREAIVFVNRRDADSGRLRVRFLVDKASWSPSYNVRTDQDRRKVRVEYNGSIEQMSGEDWTDVLMTLSTATPNLVARAPSLTPLTITIAPAEAQQIAASADEYAKAKREILFRQRAMEMARNNGLVVGMEEGQRQPAAVDAGAIIDNLFSNDTNLNYIAGELQNLDLIARTHVQRAPATRPKTEEGVTVTYRLAARTSLPSRSDQQLVQIAGLDFDGEFYKVATPVLTHYVYDQADAVNTSEMVLLAGPVATYMAGEFVGHSELPTVAIGEPFTVGFGIDSSLRALRELIERSEHIQGGNRVVNFTYRLAIENFGAAPVAVRLFDRMPKTDRGDIKLTLVATGPDLSEDRVYRQTDHKKGILRWEVEVPAQSVEPDAFAIEYKFTLEYDKQMNIAGMPVASR